MHSSIVSVSVNKDSKRNILKRVPRWIIFYSALKMILLICQSGLRVNYAPTFFQHSFVFLNHTVENYLFIWYFFKECREALFYFSWEIKLNLTYFREWRCAIEICKNFGLVCGVLNNFLKSNWCFRGSSAFSKFCIDCFYFIFVPPKTSVKFIF